MSIVVASASTGAAIVVLRAFPWQKSGWSFAKRLLLLSVGRRVFMQVQRDATLLFCDDDDDVGCCCVVV